MSETKVIDIKKLKFDENNFNKHNDEGMELLGKSISQNGYGRSILLDKDNNIVGGNGVTEKAIELGATKVRIIETDGSELIAVKRTDLSLDSKEGREMALADNGVAHVNLEWDTDALAAAEKEWGLVPEEWGVEMLDDIEIDAGKHEKNDGFVKVTLMYIEADAMELEDMCAKIDNVKENAILEALRAYGKDACK